MDRRNQLGTAFALLAVVLFTIPALFPVQAVLTHDTGPGTFDGRERIEDQGYEIVSYENLSERGRELYVRTLENGGEHRVPEGQGAPDFEYLRYDERSEIHRENPDREPGFVAIERPEDADLPPADEPFGPDEVRGELDEDVEERRQQAQRYDLMEISVGSPPLDARPQLLRLAAALLAVVSLCAGGYLLSSK